MDKNEKKLLFELLSFSVGAKRKNINIKISNEELKDIYSISKKHDVAHLIGFFLIDNQIIASDNQYYNKFYHEYIMAVVRYERINYEFSRIIEVLNDGGIDFIPLKGMVMKSFYLQPWMRTSCDIDILIHERDIDRAATLLFEKLNFKSKYIGTHDVSLYAPSGVHLELHFSLCEFNTKEATNKILNNVWHYSNTKGEGKSEKHLKDEMFYFYHIEHMAKHLKNGGCGIRPFLDVWVLTHNVNFDYSKRKNLLKNGGLEDFASAVEDLANYWFGDGKPTKITDLLEKYILNSGAYGSPQNKAIMNSTDKRHQTANLIKKIWKPYNELKYWYPSLKNKRFLLPIYEVKRWRYLIMTGAINNRKRHNEKAEFENCRYAEEILLLFDKINIT